MRIRRLAGAASHARRRPEQWLSVRHGLARERTTTIAENAGRGRRPVLPAAGQQGAPSAPLGMGSPRPEGRILVLMKPARAAPRRFLPGSPLNNLSVDPPVEQFTVRDRVTHDKYGLGWVVLVEDDEAVIVDFGSRKVRILSPFAKLTKL
jgi:hypothetical protein